MQGSTQPSKVKERKLRFFATSPGAAKQAGLWRYAFARQGVQLATTDCLIAAIAHERGAALVTGNMDSIRCPNSFSCPFHAGSAARGKYLALDIQHSRYRLSWMTLYGGPGMLDVLLCVSARRAFVIHPGMFAIGADLSQQSWRL
jgi:hypothetical protein